MNQNSKTKSNPLYQILTNKVDTQMDYHGVSFKRDLALSDTILSVRHLKMFFPMGQDQKLKAVHDISFDIKKGECFGLVGESGCGKTTTGRSIIRLYDITSGSVYFKGLRINAGSRWNEKEIKWTQIRTKNKVHELRQQERSHVREIENQTPEGKLKRHDVREAYEKQIAAALEHEETIIRTQKEKIHKIRYDDSHVDPKLLSKMQMIFQDPIDSLDPRMTVEDIIQEGLKIQGFRNKQENHQKACEVLEEVGLISDYCSRYPNEFSGGQRQRIGIARALIMNPELLICDEPISALDVSIRAQIINLLNDLKENHGLTLLFIAHDLSVVKYFCDRIAVMYFGQIVEMTSSNELFRHPLHPYTRALLSAIPKPDPISEKKRKRLIYNPAKEHDYSKDGPKFQEILPGHWILANTEEMVKYRELIQKDDLEFAQKAAEEKK
jgi:oligopeptide transport system ATP-binding protein